MNSRHHLEDTRRLPSMAVGPREVRHETRALADRRLSGGNPDRVTVATPIVSTALPHAAGPYCTSHLLVGRLQMLASKIDPLVGFEFNRTSVTRTAICQVVRGT
jgi:hypothetical protein